jgi:hypothetical protein
MKRVVMRSILPVSVVVLAAALLACSDDEPAGNAPTGSIAGTITFRNTWPPTGNVYVTINSSYPPTGAPDAFTNPIPPGVRSYDYTLGGIETGTYVAVLIGWRGGPGNDKCIGMYWEYVDSLGVTADCTSQPPGPSPVIVTKDATIPDIDMVADLDLAD